MRTLKSFVVSWLVVASAAPVAVAVVAIPSCIWQLRGAVSTLSTPSDHPSVESVYFDAADQFDTGLVWRWIKYPTLVGAFGTGVAFLWAGASLGLARIRKGTPRVFFTYQHELAAVVKEIVEALRDRVETDYVTFQTDVEHDALLDKIYSGIRACDVLVCIPGPRASFVEAEVAFGIALKKPILLVIGEDGQAPNTAHRSYPAFNLAFLREHQFRPLEYFVTFMYGDWRSTLTLYRQLREPPRWAITPALIALILAAPLVPVGVLLMIGTNILGALGFDRGAGWLGALSTSILYLVVIPTWSLAAMAMAIGMLTWIPTRQRVRNLVARTTIEGTYSYGIFEQILGKSFVASHLAGCLWKQPPSAHHDLSLGRSWDADG
jgi:hypothetical protein